MANLQDLKLEYWLRQRNAGKLIWTTKEGKNISIKDMTDSHLLNCINMIETKEDEYDRYMEALGSIGDKDLIDF